MPYQSPISLNKNDLILINQSINITGKNNGATFDSLTKNFNVNDTIILERNAKKYILIEYHFHIPSEHKNNKKQYPAEIH